MTDKVSDITYDLDLLEASRSAWERSDGLRFIYADLYGDVQRNCLEGSVLEIGSGIAVSREFIKNVYTTDVAKTDYVDQAMSAYAIERLQQADWKNIFAIDVLHHLKQPLQFFQSAAGALAPGGRIILVEPAATLWGRFFYSLCHHEPIVPQLIVPPFEFDANGVDGEFANMGMAVGLFRDHRSIVAARLAEFGLTVKSVRYRDVLAYPLTGGYSKPQVLPISLLRVLARLEALIPQCLYRFIGLRMVIVLEKISD